MGGTVTNNHSYRTPNGDTVTKTEKSGNLLFGLLGGSSEKKTEIDYGSDGTIDAGSKSSKGHGPLGLFSSENNSSFDNGREANGFPSNNPPSFGPGGDGCVQPRRRPRCGPRPKHCHPHPPHCHPRPPVCGDDRFRIMGGVGVGISAGIGGPLGGGISASAGVGPFGAGASISAEGPFGGGVSVSAGAGLFGAGAFGSAWGRMM